MTEKIEISVPIFPSEDIGKVKQAVSNLLETPNFNEIRINGTTYLTCILEERAGLDKLREMIKKERIRNAARRLMTSVPYADSFGYYIGSVTALSNQFGKLKMSMAGGLPSSCPRVRN